MNPNLCEILFILDRSGSMEDMREPAIAGFNAFLKTQLDVPGDARLTLVQFDNAYEVHVPALAIQDVPQLSAQTYVPRGSTALLDAIGRTVRETDHRLQSLPEPDRPGKVVVAIFTDGLENASREFSQQHVADLIRLYRDEKGWEFIFLAANQDAIASAAQLNISAHLSADVAFNECGITSGSTATSRKVRALRMKLGGRMDSQALEDDGRTMSELIREEEQKPRPE